MPWKDLRFNRKSSAIQQKKKNKTETITALPSISTPTTTVTTATKLTYAIKSMMKA